MVQAGELGEINAVRAFYIQGWLRTRLEKRRTRSRPRWRTDPEAVRRGRLLRRHRHARLQPRPLHHRPAARPDFVPRSRPSSRAGRSTTTAPPSSATSNGALGTVTASQIIARPRERPVDRGRRHQGRPGVASGRAEQDAGCASTASRTSSTPAPAARTWASRPATRTRIPQRPSRGVPRSVRQHLHGRLRRHDRPRRQARSSTARNTLYPNVADGVDGMNFITQCVASSQGERRLEAAEARVLPVD